jgi:hypothetical protein
MDGGIRFFNHSRTVNEQLIIDTIDEHGDYVLHTTESVLARRYVEWDGICIYADILTMFRKNKRDYLIGIEVKDWKAIVNPKLCWNYLKTYRKSCEYFYLAARKFSPTVHMIDEVGLIDLEKMKIVKKAEYLFPKKEYRAGVVKRLKKVTPIRRNIGEIIEDPYQLSLDKFF